MDRDVLFVSCTRGGKEGTELYRSLARLSWPIDTLFFEGNREGLSARYNSVLNRVTKPNQLVVFAHDDLRIGDPELLTKVKQTDADIIGLVGSNTFAVDPDRQFLMWNAAGDPHLSGQISHAPPGGRFHFGVYGPAPRPVTVIDGIFIAVRPQRLNGVHFDERFAFHFYDLDFCLSALNAGLRISTSPPTGVTHCKSGTLTINETPFFDAQRLFVAKWGRRQYVATEPSPLSAS